MAIARAEGLRVRCSALLRGILELQVQDRLVDELRHDLANASCGCSTLSRTPQAHVPARSARTSVTSSLTLQEHTRPLPQSPSPFAFDPARVQLPDAARAIFVAHGAALLRELGDGYVDRIILTLCLERAGLRLQRRELRALHAALDGGRPGRICVEHLAAVVAICKGHAAPRPSTGSVHPFGWCDSRLHSGTREVPLPTAHLLQLPRRASERARSEASFLRGDGHDAPPFSSAVDAMIARVRAREEALTLGSVREPEVEREALRRGLADADATIRALVAQQDALLYRLGEGELTRAVSCDGPRWTEANGHKIHAAQVQPTQSHPLEESEHHNHRGEGACGQPRYAAGYPPI
ncbi:hypothetical protein T492DRAFT_1068616 [Pavlovales sp. CCMP2436]|nr:hypothetical protein T492DRAFT_1068616 [Pavlovales sp. CCMP2436]|mmetsp:Transcript_15946/g.40727  ORF Transcript_15946/g.40727 Transcript_15946/m.40727 type:complete len:352 (+) Transcript_15946:139-1194(+)